MVLGLSLGCPTSDKVSSDPGGSNSDADTDTDTDTDTDADTDTDTDTDADPLDLALEMSEANLTETIQDLEDFTTRHTFTEGSEEARGYLVDRLEGYGYIVEVDEFSVSGHATANLIARKEGADNPDIVYLFSAHYDSTSSLPETLAPGADDNASAVAAVLEAARILQSHTLRYSVWFVLTGAEEQGSQGSEHMVEWMTTQGVDARGVIAPDMIGYWPLGDGDAMDILGDADSAHLVEIMAATADELGVAYKDWIDHEYCYGDDHTNFQEAGFPAITPMDCVEAHNISSSGETLPHYHQTSDTLSTLHMPFTTRVAGVIVATLAKLAVPITPDPPAGDDLRSP